MYSANRKKKKNRNEIERIGKHSNIVPLDRATHPERKVSILPVLTCGSETWRLTEDLRNN